jgi:hypothetical protein
VKETSGSPTSGTRDLAFDGDALGAQAGVHWQSRSELRGRFEVGASARWLPELKVTGSEIDILLAGTSMTPADAKREAGWEGGTSVAYGVNEAFRVMGGFGGRTAQDWIGFGVTAGASYHWALAGDYHHPEEAWGLHFGGGADHQDDVLDERATTFGLAGDWTLDKVVLTASAMRRGLERASGPTSWDTRFMGGVRASF